MVLLLTAALLLASSALPAGPAALSGASHSAAGTLAAGPGAVAVATDTSVRGGAAAAPDAWARGRAAEERDVGGGISTPDTLPPTASTPLDAGGLARRLDGILDDPALAHAHVGMRVELAETGEVLYERAADRRFVPASNAKLVTAAVSLHELGPAYRWTTRLLAAGSVADDTLRGDLWIVGGGDPLLTRDEVRSWADTLARRGVRHVEGDVVGDDRAFREPRWGEGWTWEDLHAGWGAGVTALQLHPVGIDAVLQPGTRPGAPASLHVRTPGPPPPPRPAVRTGAEGSSVRLHILPEEESARPVLSGWVPADADSVRLRLAPGHPTRYFLDFLESRLDSAGVTVAGEFRRARRGEAPPPEGEAQPTDGGGRRVAWTVEQGSDSLGAVLPELLKPSDNQIAENLLRTLGREEGRQGSAEEGLEVLADRVHEWGISPDAFRLVDGSGLSRYNEITPRAMVRLLRTAWRLPHHDLFRDALPLAAEDGTLRGRLLGTPAAGNLRGKTGSLSSVRALSGYVEDGDGETLIFALFVNGFAGPGDVAEALEDLLVEQLSLYHRPVEPGWPEYREP